MVEVLIRAIIWPCCDRSRIHTGLDLGHHSAGRISNYIHYQVCDKIANPFPNFDGAMDR